MQLPLTLWVMEPMPSLVALAVTQSSLANAVATPAAVVMWLVELTNNSNQTPPVSLEVLCATAAMMFVQVSVARPINIPKLAAAPLWAIPCLLAVTMISLVSAVATPAALVM
jgi:hypothetical protein